MSTVVRCCCVEASALQEPKLARLPCSIRFRFRPFPAVAVVHLVVALVLAAAVVVALGVAVTI